MLTGFEITAEHCSRRNAGDGADLRTHIPVREQHAARSPCRPGGEVHGGDGIRLQFRKRLPFFFPKPFDEFMQLQEHEARDRLCEQSGGLAAAFVVEKKPAVGQPQTVFQLLKLQTVVQRDDHPPGGEHGEKRGKPGGAARSEKGDVPLRRKSLQRGRRLFAEAEEL